LCGAASDYAPFGAPPPLMVRRLFVKTVGKARGARKAQRENDEFRHCERSEAIQWGWGKP
jgi:hypothetical protein